MKLLYLLLLVLPALEARPAATHQRYGRQAGRYGAPGGYRPNLAYSSNNNPSSASSNGIGIGGNGNVGNSYGNGNSNANGQIRLAYAPASGALATRPYNGIGGFKFGGRPAPGSDFVVNAVGGGAGGPGGGFSANHPQAVYKNGGGSVGRPQTNTVYRLGPGQLASGGRPLAAVSGGGGYQSG